MHVSAAISFAAPSLLAAGVALWLATLAIAVVRKIHLQPATATLLVAGLLMLALASGDPRYRSHADGPITVMVDLSPSTRGASFRSLDWLQHRIAALVHGRRCRFLAFADQNRPLPPGDVLPDLPTDQTRFAPPPDAAAILLLSDGRFPLPPQSPPVFPIVDPALDSPDDSAITDLQLQDQHALVSVRSHGQRRELTVCSGTSTAHLAVANSQVLAMPTHSNAEIIARLSGGDRWPENDSLSILPPPPAHLQRWWVGRRASGAGWTLLRPDQLPLDPAAYLAAAVVVLDNVSADSLSLQQSLSLDRFVRDFGGGLLLVGGTDAFGSALAGSPLNALSPLAPTPPGPAARWMLLIDASGSMAAAGPAPDASQSLWQTECAAARAVLPALPPADRVTAASFSGAVQWWWDDVPAAGAVSLPLPPPSDAPHGPTDLTAALHQAADRASTSLPTNLLLMTDANATPLDSPSLIASLNASRIRLDVLALAEGAALPSLRQIAGATGGAVVQQSDPARWVAAARQLARAAWDDLLRRGPAIVHFRGQVLAGWTDARAAGPVNRTWLRTGASLGATLNESTDPAAATWRVGAGQVGAMAWAADVNVCNRLANVVATPPRDPRFTVTCKPGVSLRISVDAIDAGQFMNGLHVDATLRSLQPGGPDAQPHPLLQVGPGRYEADLPPPRQPMVAAVRVAGTVVDRLPIAARYPPEFDAIGNDRANLQRLALRSGGRVIDPAETGPIELLTARREIKLLPWLAIIAAVLLALGAARVKSHRPTAWC